MGSATKISVMLTNVLDMSYMIHLWNASVR